MTNYGKAIRRMRAERGIYLFQTCARTVVDVATMSGMETGRLPLNLAIIAHVAECLVLTEDEYSEIELAIEKDQGTA